jgi:lipopolysaccharide export system permease protein
MIRILDRLVARTFLRLFLIFVLGAPLLFILGDATEKLNNFMDRGLPLDQILLSYAYQYPQFVFWSLPIAALLAAVFTIQPMTVHREVMAAKAGGISFHRMVAPLFLLGLVFTGLGLVLADLVPHANARSAELRGDREVRQAWRSNAVYITDQGESLSFRRITAADGRMTGVVLFRQARGTEDDEAGGTVVHIVADEAQWSQEGGWELRNGFLRELDPDGTERLERFAALPYDRLTEAPVDLVESVRDEDEMTRAQLAALADRVTRSGGDPGRLEVKREQRLAIPVATLIIILFGAPLATSSKRGGAAFGIGLALGTTILYLVLFRVAGAFGYAGVLDPRMAAWLPNGVFLLAGTILMLRTRT